MVSTEQKKQLTKKGKIQSRETVRSARPVGLSNTSPATSNIYRPWDAVVCGIDQGEVSGFSCWVRGYYSISNLVVSAVERRDCVEYAYTRALANCIPIIFIFEQHNPWTPQSRINYKIWLAMGENKGRWKQEIEKLSSVRWEIIDMRTQYWRKQYNIKGPREQAKKQAILIANSLVNDKINDDNVAEGILIGKVGTYSMLCEIKGLRRI